MDRTLIQIRQERRRNQIFKLIQKNNELLSRFDICRLTGYSTTTVTASVDSLVAEGLVIEDVSKETRVGRRPSLLQINSDSLFFLGIECSASGVNLTVINTMLEEIHHEFRPLRTPLAKDILDTMQILLNNYLTNHPGIWKKIPALVFSIPGKLDENTGLAIQYRTVPDWKNIDLYSRFSYLGKKMYFINNVDAMLTGYQLQHQMDSRQSIMFIIIRNSAGVRLFSQGQFLSHLGIVCEAGHMQATNSTRRCACGKKGCYDAEVSLNAVVNKFRETYYAGLFNDRALDPGEITIGTFLQLVKEEEPAALDIFSEVARYIAQMLETLFAFFHPDVTILSTYLNEENELLNEKLQNYLMKHDLESQSNIVYIPPANELASFGAAVTGYDFTFPLSTADT